MDLQAVDNKPVCQICCDSGWVCEDHRDRPWGGESDSERACSCGGAGAPCPGCNQSDRDNPPRMPPGYKSIIDSEDGWTN